MKGSSRSGSGTAGGKITLAGAVPMGTGVMIGAGGVHADGPGGDSSGSMVPFAFGLAALVAGTTAYSYVKL